MFQTLKSINLNLYIFMSSTFPKVTFSNPNILQKLQETCDSAESVANALGKGLVKGALSGLTGGTNEKESLSEKISQIVEHGIGAASVIALEKLLEKADTFDLDPNEQDLKKDMITVLTNAKTLPAKIVSNQNTPPTATAKNLPSNLMETAKNVWNTLNKYHILIGGVNVNFKSSSDEELKELRKKIAPELKESSNNNGITPINSLIRCQEAYRSTRISHHLSYDSKSPITAANRSSPWHKELSLEELKKIRELEQQTDKMVSKFALDTTHYTTMITLHYLFNPTIDPSEYKKYISDGGDIQKTYLSRYINIKNNKRTVRYFFYYVVYSLIFWLVRPIIEPTIEKVVTHVRTFLKNDVDLLHFIEQKIDDMLNYYGRIEKGRQDYLNPNRKDEAGSFDEYLEQNIKIYGAKYTEQDLIKIFSEYIVENYVPRSKITVRGKRIPLISTFLEWIIYSLRKSIIRGVLKKTNVVQKMLTQSTGSVHYAQLGIKRILEQKLAKVVEMIDHARISSAEQRSSEKLILEAKKIQLITDQMHNKIKLHSQKLLRFIDIESCNGEDQKLRGLDNRVSQLATDSLMAVANIFKADPPSIENMLQNASTNMIETALVSLFEDKEEQIELQLQTIFEICEKTYTYVPENDRARKELEYHEECALIDEKLNILQEQLARSAVAKEIENFLENASTERHKAIKAYVLKEETTLKEFITDLDGLFGEFKEFTDLFYITNPETFANEIHTQELKQKLGEIVFVIESHLSHLTMQLRSPQLENCYDDVRGDLHNTYACVIHSLDHLHKNLEAIAKKVDKLSEHEDELVGSESCHKLLNSISFDKSYKEAKPHLEKIIAHSPKSMSNVTFSQMKNLADTWLEYEKNAAALRACEDYNKMNDFNGFKDKFNELAIICRAHHDARVNTKYKDQKNVEDARAEFQSNVSRLLNEIRTSQDPNIKTHILPLIKSDKAEDLYPIFHSSWFRSRIPIFKKLDQINRMYQKKIATYKQLPGREILENKKDELSAKMTNIVSEMHVKLSVNTQVQIKNVNQTLDSIDFHFSRAIDDKTKEQKIGEIMTSLEEFNTHFNVKGYISVGQLEITHAVAPKVTELISKEVTKGTRALIGAMGKRQHYKQLVLRGLFLEVARRQEDASSDLKKARSAN